MTDATITLRLAADGRPLAVSLKDAEGKVRDFGVEGERAGERAGRGMRNAREEAGAFGSTVSTLKGQLVGAFAGFSIARLAAEFVQTADAAANMAAKIRLVTESNAQAAAVQAELFDISQRSSASLDSTVTLYSRMANALRDAGATTGETLGLVETINKAFAVSGATASETGSAVLQLSQALGAGALRGEEFNAVNEAAPRLMKALADSLGVPRGALKDMAEDGKLTADVLREAFSGEQAAEIAAEFEVLPNTVGRSFERMKNAAILSVAALDQDQGVTGILAGITDKITEIFQNAAGAIPLMRARVAEGIGAIEKRWWLFREAVIGVMFEIAGDIASVWDGIQRKLADGIDTVAAAYSAIPLDKAQEIAAAATKIANNLRDGADAEAGFREEQERLAAETKRQIELIDRVVAEQVDYYQAIDVSKDALESQTGATRRNTTTTKENTDAKAKAKEADRAMRDAARDLADAGRDLEKILAGQTDEFERQAAEIGGPAVASLIEYENAIDEILATYARLAAYGPMPAEITTKVAKALENAAIAHENRLVGIQADAEREREKSAADHWSVLEQVTENGSASVSAIIADGMTGAFESVGDIGDAIVETFRRMIADIIAEALRVRIIGPMFRSLFGGVAAASPAAALAGPGGSILGTLGAMSGGGSGALLGALGGASAPGGGIGGGASAPGGGIGGGLGLLGGLGGALGGFGAGFGVLGASVANMGLLGGLGATTQFGLASLASGNMAVGLGALAGPIALVAGIAALVDKFSGGKLFGTSYKPESGEQRINFGDNVTGTLSQTEVRQRSLFRGRQWRTTTSALGDDVLDPFRELAEQLRDLAGDIGREFGAEAADLVTGSFRQTFDKDGKLTGEFSTVLGRTFRESAEEFQKRLMAEQILAGISIAMRDSLAKGAAIGIGEGAGGGGGGRRDGGDPGGIGGTGAQADEIQRIAERWRDNADDLLEGANFLLLAASALRSGDGLLPTLTETADLVEELADGGETLSQTFARLLESTGLLEQALDLSGAALDLTREEFVRFADEIADAAGGIDAARSLWSDYFAAFYTDAERAENALASLSEARSRELADIGLDESTTAAQFRAAFEAALPTLSAEEIVQWLEAGRALAQFDQAIDGVNQRAREAAAFTQSLGDAVLEQEGSAFEIARRRIQQTAASAIESANALARAQGLEGASARDLALIHRYVANAVKRAIAELEGAAAGLIDQLGYGELSGVEAQIAAIEASLANSTGSQVDAIGAVGDASADLFEQWIAGVESVKDYVDGLLVGDLSPLSPEERLAEARSQLDQALAAAQGGDVQALQALPQLADQWLRMLRESEASGEDYNGPARALIEQLRALGVNPYSPTGGGTGGVPTTVSLVPSDELAELYARRDELIAQREAEQRLALATQLADTLREIAGATGETLFAVAERMGVSMAQFVGDLGGDVSADSAEAVATLAQVANTLDVELGDLAESLGLTLGELSDAQSLMNDAFEAAIAGLPEGFREQLEPALRDLENASSPEEQVEALERLEEITGELPDEFRLALAPYLANIDPLSPDLFTDLDFLSGIDESTRQANLLLAQIRNEIILGNGGNIPKREAIGESAIVSGSAVFASGYAAPTVGDAIVVELRALRAEVAALRAESSRGSGDIVSAVQKGADKQSDAYANASREQIEAINRSRVA
jgi:tape measure domain-containing protein